MSFLLSILACKSPIVETIPGVDTALSVVVSTPATCGFCDPLVDIDTLRLEVSIGGSVVASDNFSYPDEAVTLPDLTGFGVVRITLLGLADGRVLSAGRTAEIVLLPDTEQSAPLVFLPINRGIPLDVDMAFERSRHLALSRRDGSVLLIGGLDARQERATASVEVYDAASGTFTELDALPTNGVGEPRVANLEDGASLLIGGFAVRDGVQIPNEESVFFDETLFTAAGNLSQGRAGHCVAMFRDRQGIVLGGAAGGADYLKPDDTGLWGFSGLEMRDFDAGSVTGCAVVEEGRVFAQGRDAASTGLWDVRAEGADPAESFTALVEGTGGDFRYVQGAVVLPDDEGGAWVIGGADVGTGEVVADSRRFIANSLRFAAEPGLTEPRMDGTAAPWIQEGWYAIGCGWADNARTAGASSVELFRPTTGDALPPIDLDRDRAGCGMSVLRDGSLLLTGGYASGVGGMGDAALVVPWAEALAAE